MERARAALNNSLSSPGVVLRALLIRITTSTIHNVSREGQHVSKRGEGWLGLSKGIKQRLGLGLGYTHNI